MGTELIPPADMHSDPSSADAASAPRRAMPSPIEELAPQQLEAMDAEEWLDWYFGLDASFREAHRDHLLCEGLRAGLTLQALGELYGISRERVRQVTQREGLNAIQLKIERRSREERRARRLARRVYGISLSYPELDVSEIADLAECDEATVLKGLGKRKAIHVQHDAHSEPNRTSNEVLLAALGEWGAQTSRLTGDDYTAWAMSRGLPGKQTISIRFGSWNAALQEAGLAIKDRGGTRPQLDDATLWATLYEFFTSDAASFTAGGYDEWARQEDRASLATLRNRLGTWSMMWERSRALLRYAAQPDGSWSWAEEVLAIVPGDVMKRIISPEDCVAALQQVAPRVAGPLTAQAYEQARDAAHPSPIAVQKKWGSWIAALHAAGLNHRMSGKARGRVARGEVVLSPAPAPEG